MPPGVYVTQLWPGSILSVMACALVAAAPRARVTRAHAVAVRQAWTTRFMFGDIPYDEALERHLTKPQCGQSGRLCFMQFGCHEHETRALAELAREAWIRMSAQCKKIRQAFGPAGLL